MAATVIIKGAKELLRKLKAMDTKLAKKVTRQALRKSAKPMLAAAKSRAPVITGGLRDSLKLRAGRRKKDRVSIAVVTAAGWFKGDQFYAAFVEVGTSQAPAHPYLRPAFDNTRSESLQIISSELASGIEKVAKES